MISVTSLLVTKSLDFFKRFCVDCAYEMPAISPIPLHSGTYFSSVKKNWHDAGGIQTYFSGDAQKSLWRNVIIVP